MYMAETGPVMMYPAETGSAGEKYVLMDVWCNKDGQHKE